MRVLLIDDDRVDRELVRRALTRDGASFDIDEAPTSAQGVDLYRWTPYDVVLVDYRLPDADGLETLRALRRSPEFQGAILVLTGNDDEELAERCLEAGAQDFLLKSELNSRHIGRAVQQARQRFRLEAALRRHHDQLRTLAEHDPLTGLSNRMFFDAALRSAMPLALRHGEPLALMLLDVDQFKLVNDSYGHDVGDQLLQEVARRLQGALRAGDLLCRLGGDEFAVLAHQFANDQQTLHLAERILDGMRRPIHVGGTELSCTVSIGVACYPSGASSPEELMKHADLAMYKSKRTGRNRASFFSDDLNALAIRRVTLERELRTGFAQRQFEVWYQPQFGAGGRIVAAEALLRWRHPQRGLLAPGEFLDVAEDSGLIVPIGAWVLDESCAAAARWQRAGRHRPVLSVNLSGVQLRSEDIVEVVDAALDRHGLAPTDLELEITENAMVDSPARATRILDRLTSRGTSIALDDFGTGYSSLSHLRLFPISVLKIEKSFVQGATHESREELLFQSVLQMARSLDLETVAEGVETGEQAELARRHGADRLQGHLFAQALPADAFVTLLAAAA